MLSQDGSKGIQYNMTFSQSGVEKAQGSSNQMAIIAYLNEKIKYLEIENNELKKEISMKEKEKDKIDYYLRLRRDMLEEIERSKNEKVAMEIYFNAEVDKLQGEIATLQSKLKSVNTFNNSPGRSNEEDFFSTERTGRLLSPEGGMSSKSPSKNPTAVQSSKFFQNLISENEAAANFSDDNFFLNPVMSGQNFYNNLSNSVNFKEKDTLQKGENLLFQSTVPYSGAGATLLQSEEPVKENILIQSPGSNSLNNHASQISSNNPFLPIINDLEDRIKLLEGMIQEKDREIQNMQGDRLNTKFESEIEVEKLKKESETWKQKYIHVLSAKKSLSQEFQELYEKQIENYKIQTDKTIYELEKKILHLEKMNEKYENDFEKLAKMNAESENTKQAEIENLKNNIKNIVDQYEQLYRSYEENLKILIKQIDSIKQLYLAREGEFINITKYYTESISDYSKPLAEINNANNFKMIEDQFINQTQEVEDLRNKVESYIKELTNLRSETTEAKPKIRQKISEAMRNYDENIQNIVENHNTLQSKLQNIFDFMNHFESKFIFFNSLIEDNKKLEEKINILECQLKMIDNESKDREMFGLKEQIFKLQKEADVKNNIIRDNEDTISKYENQITNLSKNTTRRVKETVPDEIVFKMKNEILVLTNQIIALNKTKESIEKFYQTELKNLMDKLNEKNEKIEELRSIIRKMENDFMGKKETIFNLWVLEFKEFKENLITIADIKNALEKFKVEGEELSVHKDRVYNEELYLLRQEAKIKDDLFMDMKRNYETDRKNLLDLVENYKKTIDGKVEAYQNLLNLKKMELEALQNEKNRLGGMDNSKKNLTENEMILWNEQREHLKDVIFEHNETKNKEIALLKNHIEILQKELEGNRKLNEANLQNVINSVEGQMSIFKERELFTVSQLLDIEEKFNCYREEKERLLSLLKDEIQDIKSHNLLLSKLKTENSGKQ